MRVNVTSGRELSDEMLISVIGWTQDDSCDVALTVAAAVYAQLEPDGPTVRFGTEGAE